MPPFLARLLTEPPILAKQQQGILRRLPGRYTGYQDFQDDSTISDAKRLSDIIDEKLRIDRRNYDKCKQGVRVCYPSYHPLALFAHPLSLHPPAGI